MVLSGISMASSSSSNSYSNGRYILITQNLTPTLSSLSLKGPITPHSATLSASASASSTVKWRKCLTLNLSRRVVSSSMFGLILSIVGPFAGLLFISESFALQLLELERYTDAAQGFNLLVPSSWIKVEKAGATVLFEDPSKKANSIGVVVSPTRISSLEEFGTPQFVADKLIQAEKRKESTKEVEVISISQRSGYDGIQVYEFEYEVDSTRGGLKRVFSAAFVQSNKLYLLNITHSDGSENPLDVVRREILEQVVHSFDAISST